MIVRADYMRVPGGGGVDLHALPSYQGKDFSLVLFYLLFITAARNEGRLVILIVAGHRVLQTERSGEESGVGNDQSFL